MESALLEERSEIQIDDLSSILGKREARYLSEGYKRVEHSLRFIHVNYSEKEISSIADILYHKEWSSKSKGARTDYHLSTLDIFILGARLCEIALVKFFALNEQDMKRSWIRRLEMNLGSEPSTELSNVPLSITLKRSNSDQHALCDTISLFSVSVGNAQATIEIDHPAGTPAEAGTPTEIINELSYIRKGCLFLDEYKYRSQVISEISTSSDRSTVKANISIDFLSEYQCRDGITSAYPTSLNILDIMLAGAQLSQLMIYQRDAVTRAESNNLWMRRFNVYLPLPIYSCGPYKVTVEIQKSRHINRGNGVWSITEPRMVIQGDNNESYVQGSFVHLLPEKKEVYIGS